MREDAAYGAALEHLSIGGLTFSSPLGLFLSLANDVFEPDPMQSEEGTLGRATIMAWWPR